MAIITGPISKPQPRPSTILPEADARFLGDYRTLRGYSHLERILMVGPSHPGYEQACKELERVRQKWLADTGRDCVGCFDRDGAKSCDACLITDGPPAPMSSSEAYCINEPVVQAMEKKRRGKDFTPIAPPIQYWPGYLQGPLSDTKLEVGWPTMSSLFGWVYMKGLWSPKKFRKFCEKQYDFLGIYAEHNWLEGWEMTAYFDFQEGAETVARTIAQKIGWATRRPGQKPFPPGLQIIKC